MHFCGGTVDKRGEIGSGGSGGSDTALMAEKPKLLYIIVNDNVDGGGACCDPEGDDVDEEDTEGHGGEDGAVEKENAVNGRSKTRSRSQKCPAPRYTRPVLQSTLQLMGCKPRHALKISDRVFDVFRRNDSVVKEDGGGCGLEVLEDARASVGVGRRGDGSVISSPSPFSHWHDSEKISAKETEQIELDRGKKSLYEQHLEAVNGITPVETRNGCGKLANKKRASVTVSRDEFLDVVCDALADYQYVGPNQRADLILACKVREKKTSVTVLLCGTSGCGKSTLSSLLASRLGITTVVSTDSLRHMMRSFVSEKENSLLWASTYHAGECLDPVAIAEAKIKTKTAKMPAVPLRSHSSSDGRLTAAAPGLNGSSGLPMPEHNDGDKDGGNTEQPSVAGSDARGKRQVLSEVNEPNNTGMLETATSDGNDATVGAKTIVVQGFKAQSEMVMDSLDRLITAWEEKNESVVVEGVHLSLNFVMGLMKKHPSIVPFMVYISNEGKHLERFAVRAKYMTLDPAKNKYVKYIRNIRTIQEYLCKRADKHLVPKVNNTNVDKSIAVIHATIFSCLRRRMGGEPLCDPATNTVKVVDQEYRRQYAASPLGSKGMFQLIQRRGSSRHLMALMNIDGSVAKAWPIEADSNGKPVSGSSNGSESGVGTPVYGPLAIGKSEPVNVRFGNFGLSAWPTDTGNASNPVSISSSGGDGHSSRGDGDLNSSCPGSSGSSSPKNLEAGEKELTEEVEVFGSDEEADEEEPTTIGSNGESSDSEQEHIDEDEGGSVDDQSERSDEEYDPAHPADDGFWSDHT